MIISQLHCLKSLFLEVHTKIFPDDEGSVIESEAESSGFKTFLFKMGGEGARERE